MHGHCEDIQSVVLESVATLPTVMRKEGSQSQIRCLLTWVLYLDHVLLVLQPAAGMLTHPWQLSMPFTGQHCGRPGMPKQSGTGD